MDENILKGKLTERKDRLLDKVLDLFDYSADHLEGVAKKYVSKNEPFVLSIHSLKLMLESILDSLKGMSGKRYSGSVIFYRYVKDILSQYWAILNVSATANEVVDNIRQSIMGELDNVIGPLFKVMHSKPKREGWRKTQTEDQVNEYISNKLNDAIPGWRDGLITYCSQKLSSMEVIERMMAPEKKE